MATINITEDTLLWTLYCAALILKMLLCDSPGMTCKWPPTSDDLNVSEAKSVVPFKLYNLISWIIGATEEPTLAHYVHIPDDLNLKVISICQDIVYLASKGRRQTGRCSCMSARLSCTDFCWCQICANVSQETEERSTWDDGSDYSDRDDTDE